MNLKNKSGTIQRMWKNRKITHPKVPHKYLIFICSIVAVVLIALLVWQIPSVQTRFDWRIETVRVFLHTLIQPIKEVPTSISSPVAEALTPIITNTRVQPVQSTPTTAETVTTPTALPITPTNTPLPPKVVLDSPPFEGQDWNNCGPVSLSMYLNYYGWEGDQYDISDEVKPLRADRNVNVDELTGYVYQNVGWLNAMYRVDGDIQLLRRLIHNGFPVMIEETMYMEEPFWNNDDLWAGHYLLLTGYDDQLQSFISQDSYIGPDRSITYAQLDSNWQAFNRVYLLVYPSNRENEIIDILGDDWDADQNRQDALLTAQHETSSNRDNVFAWFNLGTNLVYFDRYTEAAQAYDKARTLNMPQRMLRYQFGPFLAYFHSGRIDDLLTLTDYALTVTSNSEEALLWKGWALYRSNKTLEAIQCFQKALEYKPDYSDAIYAIQFVQGQ